MGPWFRELQGHISDVVNGTTSLKYYHKWVWTCSHLRLLTLGQLCS